MFADFVSESHFESVLPPLPRIAEEVGKVVDDPVASFEDIAKVIETEPTLSSGLLKLANSSFYGYPVPVNSVPEALSVVGLRNARNLAIALVFPGDFEFPSSYPIDRSKFWTHSIAVGLCARMMAIECREPNTERHFLAGFFHKIGRPLIAKIHPAETLEAIKTVKSQETHFNDLMVASHGIDESQVAAICLKSWGMSYNIENLVRYHSKPVLARQNIRGVSILHLASFIASSLEIGSIGDRFVPEFSEAAWGYAAFEYSKLSIVVTELMKTLDEVNRIFLEPSL